MPSAHWNESVTTPLPPKKPSTPTNAPNTQAGSVKKYVSSGFKPMGSLSRVNRVEPAAHRIACHSNPRTRADLASTFIPILQHLLKRLDIRHDRSDLLIRKIELRHYVRRESFDNFGIRVLNRLG